MLPHPARRESRCGNCQPHSISAAPAGVHAWLSNSSFADPRRQRLPALSGIARWRAHLVAAELAPQARLPSSAAIGKSAPAPCSRDSCTAAPAARPARPRRVTNCVMPWRRGVITDLAALESGPRTGHTCRPKRRTGSPGYKRLKWCRSRRSGGISWVYIRCSATFPTVKRNVLRCRAFCTTIFK